MPTIHRIARLSVFVIVLACLAACGGGHGGGGGNDTGVDSASPAQFHALVPTFITLNGRGFTKGGAAPANVRLIAQSGTPFAGGTSAQVDVAGTIWSDSVMTFTTPMAVMCPSTGVGVLVHITLPDGFPINSTGPLLALGGASIVSVSPSPIPGGTPTALTITGAGFGPNGSPVQVTFTATSGTPFEGGTSATTTVTGAVASETSINALSPVVNADTTATVSATFANGSCATSATAIATFDLVVGPTITTSVTTTSATADLIVTQGDRVSFTVTATDAEGDNVTLRLLNPPAGATFTAAVNAPSPTTATLSWVVDAGDDAGPIPLVFQANDSVSASVTSRRIVWLHLTPRAVRTVRIGDVTGDGIKDVVASARNADVAALADTGALYVWAGATTPSGTPTATLVVSGALALDAVATGGFRLVDVSGDGTLDVVAATNLADAPGAIDAGAIYVWRGGASLTGLKTADATLTVGAGGSATGLASTPMLWQVGDVSGDGVADITAAAPFADAGIVLDAGALYMWRGGATLTGPKAPDANLVVTGAVAGDELGAQGLQLGDVTGDGVLDVLSASIKADPGAVSEAGAMYVWAGGAGLTSTVAATATLTASGAAINDHLGTGVASAVRLVDVAGDASLDVIASVSNATVAGATGAGAILVWNGGASLSGPKTPDATLTVAGALTNDHMGAGAHTRLLIGDVSGDGRGDVIGVASDADVSGTLDAGALYVWRGGATLTGAKPADATLTVTGAIAGDRLGSGGTRLVDVTGDGTLDIVTVSPLADGLVANTGAVSVWTGGASLLGAVSATAQLAVTAAIAQDRLGEDPANLCATIRFADVAGTNALDVIVPAVQADIAGLVDVGAVYVWNGGAGLAGSLAASATLTVAGAITGDRLGAASGSFVSAADVSGDGTFDVLAATPLADVGGVVNAGSIAVWRGGVTLTGVKVADALLTAVTPRSDDQLAGGVVDGVAWDLFDVNGDGVRDVVAVAPLANTATLTDAGAGYVWAGGAAMIGVKTATAVLLAPSAQSGDFLGRSGTNVDLLFGADVTGEGTADILIGASEYTGAGAIGQGGLFLWRGGAGLTGTPSVTSAMVVSGAAALDRLGN